MERRNHTERKVIRRGGDCHILEGMCPLSKGQLPVGSNQSWPCRGVSLTLSGFQIFQEKPDLGFNVKCLYFFMLATRSKF